MFKVGTVIHYYDTIGVAVIELENLLAVGDKIRFTLEGTYLFEQDVDSIQFEHSKLQSAKKGDKVGIATVEPVEVGTEVFKMTL